MTIACLGGCRASLSPASPAGKAAATPSGAADEIKRIEDNPRLSENAKQSLIAGIQAQMSTAKRR